VRTFIVLVTVRGSHPNLMPDLTASLDVELQRIPGVFVVPRDAVTRSEGQDVVEVQRRGSFQRQPVTLGPSSARDVVITSGIQDGVTIARNAAGTVR
jgi:multidrug efflux pump subunit AcrA (membrane-fusion protein)